tara:strand:+ start:365 stop:991 length:627 start_codon:yes stop_codon:yes gene_type:complete
MLKGIIFDFDGVIAQSVKVKTDAFALIYKPYGKEIVNKVINHHIENGGVSRFEKIKFYHENFLKVPITVNEISKLADDFSKIVLKKVIASAYVPGAIEYINNCYKKYMLFISTGTPTNEIKKILKIRNINKYFTNVYGSPQNKSKHIDQIKIKYKLQSNELKFFGDSYSDLYAAKKARVNFILVRNKHNDKLSSNFDGESIKNFREFL